MKGTTKDALIILFLVLIISNIYFITGYRKYRISSKITYALNFRDMDESLERAVKRFDETNKDYGLISAAENMRAAGVFFNNLGSYFKLNTYYGGNSMCIVQSKYFTSYVDLMYKWAEALKNDDIDKPTEEEILMLKKDIESLRTSYNRKDNKVYFGEKHIFELKREDFDSIFYEKLRDSDIFNKYIYEIL